MRSLPSVLIGLLLGCAVVINEDFSIVRADEASDLLESIPWVEGPGLGELGNYGQIKVPEGFVFTGPGGTAQFLELTHNLPDPTTMGILMPATDEESWVVYFNYRDSGHVRDDEKDEINSTELMKAMRQNEILANQERRNRGWGTLEIVNWAVRPGYEEATNRLAWALLMQDSDGNRVVNYDVRLLGRTGVMSATLVCGPDEVQSLVPRLQNLLQDYEFKAGYRYGEWREGDKTATYGLTGLIVGGAAVVAAKSGWLSKLAVMFAKAGKAIFIAVVAGIAGLWRLITGRAARRSQV